MEPLPLIGLDGEMSGANLTAGGRLIQAGFAVETTSGYEVYCSLINPGTYLWEPAAAKVHGITEEEIAAAPDAATVDEEAATWLTERGGIPGKRKLIAVGYNVAAFDFPFFRAALPRTMSMVSRRAIDLNAAAMLLHGLPRPGGQAKWTTWKKRARRATQNSLKAAGIPGEAHNAGWDAAEALVAYRYYRDALTAPAPAAHTPLGAGLTARLKAAGDAVLTAAENSGFTSENEAGKWFGRPSPQLGGAIPFQLLATGDDECTTAVITALVNRTQT